MWLKVWIMHEHVHDMFLLCSCCICHAHVISCCFHIRFYFERLWKALIDLRAFRAVMVLRASRVLKVFGGLQVLLGFQTNVNQWFSISSIKGLFSLSTFPYSIPLHARSFHCGCIRDTSVPQRLLQLLICPHAVMQSRFSSRENPQKPIYYPCNPWCTIEP